MQSTFIIAEHAFRSGINDRFIFGLLWWASTCSKTEVLPDLTINVAHHFNFIYIILKMLFDTKI